MFPYALLIFDDESRSGRASAAEVAEVLRAHDDFVARHPAAVVGVNRLRPSSAATSVRVQQTQRLITDGPFVESKEQLGGFYLIRARDLDEALALAAEVPAPWGGVEVRPLWPEEP